jgi:hypothetical protein
MVTVDKAGGAGRWEGGRGWVMVCASCGGLEYFWPPDATCCPTNVAGATPDPGACTAGSDRSGRGEGPVLGLSGVGRLSWSSLRSG